MAFFEMCIDYCQHAPQRRRFLTLAAASIAATSFWGRPLARADAPATRVTADEAIARLKSGNEKFVSAPQLCALSNF